MKRLGILLFFILLANNFVFAEEIKISDLPQEQNSQEINVPKGLLNDDKYKIKGRVEYDENGVMFLDENDVDKLNLKVNLPKKYPKKSVLSEEKVLLQIEEQKKYNAPKVDEYLISTFSNSLEYTHGNFSYGTTFGTEMDTAQLEYRTKFFAKYDNKFLGFMTAVGKDAYTSSGRQMNSIYLTPEIKLTKSLSLVDSFKANPDYERFRNDIILRYSPKINHSRDNFQLEAGLSQTSYYTSGEQFYQFSLSTKFKI